MFNFYFKPTRRLKSQTITSKQKFVSRKYQLKRRVITRDKRVWRTIKMALPTLIKPDGK